MANAAYPSAALLTDPGYLYYAPLASTLPANTVAGSVFTDTWPVAWVALGLTDSGSKLITSLTTSPISAAEKIDPLAYRTTDRANAVSFMLKSFTATNLQRALNGASTTVTGSGATLLTKVTPPVPGQEVRCMIGFESLDSTYRFIAYQCLNQGSLEFDFQKAPANTNVPWDLVVETPSSGNPVEHWFTGATRA